MRSAHNCYKCGTADDLSIKARLRDGTVRTRICKSCRNAASKAYKEARGPKPEPLFNITEQTEWEIRAKQSYERIVRKYSNVTL